MVLEISFSNIFSMKNEVTLNLQAASLQTKQARELDGNTFCVASERLLKTIAIYGANASGKTCIIKAAKACVKMILESHNYNEDTVFDFVPFKFATADTPTTFSIRFIMNGVEHVYSFSMTRTEILTEELYYYPNGRKSLVFSRDESKGLEKKDRYEFRTAIRRPHDVVTNTSRKTLFLSRASQMDRDIPKAIFKYFNENVVLGCYATGGASLERMLGKEKEILLNILRIADSDIVDIKSRMEASGLAITTFHRNNPAIPFDFVSEESEGTRKLFNMMLTIIDVVRNGKLLLVDEIEASLHTKLVEYIIALFNRSKSAQLVCTTHNTHLLDTTKMRKDQIYFVNKTSDGASDLYSLFDFKDFRENMDMEKAYLQGRFDAVPYINDFLAEVDIAQNNE